jgi:hypothetical protein
MKIVFISIFISSFALADEINYPYFGDNGHCNIETQPCEDGKSISCFASGGIYGNCSLTANGDIWTVTCQSVGINYNIFTKSCKKK